MRPYLFYTDDISKFITTRNYDGLKTYLKESQSANPFTEYHMYYITTYCTKDNECAQFIQLARSYGCPWSDDVKDATTITYCLLHGFYISAKCAYDLGCPLASYEHYGAGVCSNDLRLAFWDKDTFKWLLAILTKDIMFHAKFDLMLVHQFCTKPQSCASQFLAYMRIACKYATQEQKVQTITMIVSTNALLLFEHDDWICYFVSSYASDAREIREVREWCERRDEVMHEYVGIHDSVVQYNLRNKWRLSAT
jgi:hypothetical protein